MMGAGELVYVVDDDAAVRDSLASLLSTVGYEVRAIPSADQFLDDVDPERPGCLLLDVRMPRIGGFGVQERLAERDSDLQIIFVTGHADVPMAVRAMKAGAYGFVEKPVNEQDLLDLVYSAMTIAVARASERVALQGVRELIRDLSGRQRQVLREIVCSGQNTKTIAHRLGISEKTVEFHRGNIMKKFGARTITELVISTSSVMKRLDNHL